MEFVKVFYQDREVGKAYIRQEGLYYAIRCSCDRVDSRKYRLCVSCCGKERDLGIGIPSRDKFVWETKIAVKHIGRGELAFYLVDSPEGSEKEFVPLRDGQPFGAIMRLERARFAILNGVPGIWVVKK